MKEKVVFSINIILIFFLAFYNLGSYPLLETSDARYAEIAFEMELNHQYFIPTFYGEWHLHKPPLLYWLTILGYKILGFNEWGARLVQAVFYLGIFFLTFWFYSFYVSKNKSLLIASALAASFPVFAAAHVVTTDLGLLFFELLALYSFFLLYTQKIKGKKRFYLKSLFWGAMIFSFLIKGPIGHFLVFPIIIIFLFKERKLKKYLTWKNFLLFILTIIIGGSWYFLLFFKNPEVFNYLIKDQLLKRVSANRGYHVHGWYYFIFYIFPLGVIPWVFFLFKPKPRPEEPDLNLFLKIITLYVLIFFTVPASKIPLYILLAFAAFIPYSLLNTRFSLKLQWSIFYAMFILLGGLLFLIGSEKIQQKLNTSYRVASVVKNTLSKIEKGKISSSPKVFLYKTKANAFWFYSGIKPIPVRLPLIKFKREYDLNPSDIEKIFLTSKKPIFLIVEPAVYEKEFSREFKKFLIYQEKKYLLFFNKKDKIKKES